MHHVPVDQTRGAVGHSSHDCDASRISLRRGFEGEHLCCDRLRLINKKERFIIIAVLVMV